MNTMRLLTWVMFVAATLNAFAPIPQHDPRHRSLIVTVFLTILSLAFVIADFGKP